MAFEGSEICLSWNSPAWIGLRSTQDCNFDFLTSKSSALFTAAFDSNRLSPQKCSTKVQASCRISNHQSPFIPHSSTHRRYTTRNAIQLPRFPTPDVSISLQGPISNRTDTDYSYPLHSLTRQLAPYSLARTRAYLHHQRSYGERTLSCKQQDTSWLSFVLR